MDTTTSALLTTVIVVGGKWTKDETISAKLIIGGLFYAILLSILAKTDDKLASKFALLVLVTATLTYGIAIMESTGLVKKK